MSLASVFGWVSTVVLLAGSAYSVLPSAASCPMDSRLTDPCPSECTRDIIDSKSSCLQTPGGCCPRVCKPYLCKDYASDPPVLCVPPGGNESTWPLSNTLADPIRYCNYAWQDCGDHLLETCQ
jgi:hypothetical protein